MYKILVVDDDNEIRNAIVELLKTENYEVVDLSDGSQVDEVLDKSFDLIILDIMMPLQGGIETCRKIREKFVTPILFLTAKNTEYDKCEGFKVGGDDYLAKPFSRIELLARVSAILRRYRIYKNENTHESDKFVEVKDLKVSKDAAYVMQGDKKIQLTINEHRILLLFCSNPNKVFNLEDIYTAVWDEKYTSTVNSSIMVHIKNLRKKLGDTSQGSKYIKNIWGRGYCIEHAN